MQGFIFALAAVGMAMGAQNDFPLYFPKVTPLFQLSEPKRTTEYPEPGQLFDSSQIIRIDVTTSGTPQMNKKYVDGFITIKTMKETLNATAIQCRLTGDGSLAAKIKNYYFKVPKGGDKDALFGWDRFSIKKSMEDSTGFREKLGSEIALSLGYYPRYAGFASVTINGEYKGIYNVLQRMRKQWIQRTFGPSAESGEKRGSQYKGDNGDLTVLYNKIVVNPNYDVADQYPIEYANKQQNLVNGEVVPGYDLKEFAKQIHHYSVQTSLSEADKQALRNLVDYDYFARAAVLDFYSGDDDGYFYQQNANHEWYHDILDGKWKLLRWDMDDGFHWEVYPASRLYTLNKKGRDSVPVLKALLKDPEYVTLYQSLLLAMTKNVFPVYSGKGAEPAYFKRYHTFYNTIVPMDKVVVDRTKSHSSAPKNAKEMFTKKNGMLRGISDRSKQVLEQAKKNNWKTINVIDSTTSQAPSSTTITPSTTSILSSSTVAISSSSSSSSSSTSTMPPSSTIMQSSTASVASSSITSASVPTTTNSSGEPVEDNDNVSSLMSAAFTITAFSLLCNKLF